MRARRRSRVPQKLVSGPRGRPLPSKLPGRARLNAFWLFPDYIFCLRKYAHTSRILRWPAKAALGRRSPLHTPPTLNHTASPATLSSMKRSSEEFGDEPSGAAGESSSPTVRRRSGGRRPATSVHCQARTATVLAAGPLSAGVCVQRAWPCVMPWKDGPGAQSSVDCTPLYYMFNMYRPRGCTGTGTTKRHSLGGLHPCKLISCRCQGVRRS